MLVVLVCWCCWCWRWCCWCWWRCCLCWCTSFLSSGAISQQCEDIKLFSPFCQIARYGVWRCEDLSTLSPLLFQGGLSCPRVNQIAPRREGMNIEQPPVSPLKLLSRYGQDISYENTLTQTWWKNIIISKTMVS